MFKGFEHTNATTTYFITITTLIHKPKDLTDEFIEDHRIAPIAGFEISDIPNTNITYSIEYNGSKAHAGYRYPFNRDAFGKGSAGNTTYNSSISLPIGRDGKQEIIIWSCGLRHMQGHLVIKRAGKVIYDYDIDVTSDWN